MNRRRTPRFSPGYLILETISVATSMPNSCVYEFELIDRYSIKRHNNDSKIFILDHTKTPRI